jgi:hypothetical protein
MIDHCPEEAAKGSQGLRSNPWEIHESAEHPQGMKAPEERRITVDAGEQGKTKAARKPSDPPGT